MVCSINAKVPAKGPSPTASTKMVAKTNSGTERKKLKKKRVTSLVFLPYLPAAGTAKSKLMTVANKVAIAEMAIVSNVAFKIFSQNAL